MTSKIQALVFFLKASLTECMIQIFKAFLAFIYLLWARKCLNVHFYNLATNEEYWRQVAAVFVFDLAISIIVRNNYGEIYVGNPAEQFVLFVKTYELKGINYCG